MPSAPSEPPETPAGTAAPSGRWAALRTPVARRVAAAWLTFFFLLAGYFAMRPLRDEIGVRMGVSRIPWLFTGTFVATLIAAPAFAWVASRVPRRRLLPLTALVLAASALAFHPALLEPYLARVAGIAFFVWLSVVNLFAVSVFWSAVAESFARDEARRCFGVIAAGGTTGAIVGSAIAGALAKGLGAESLLIAAAALLGGAAVAALRLPRRDPAGAALDAAPIEGGTWDGVGRTARSPFLLGVSLALVCQTLVATVLYVAQSEAVGAAIPQSGDRAALFASVDLAVNALTLALQLFVTGRLVARWGVGVPPALASAAVAGGLAVIGAAPGVASIIGTQIVNRAGHHAVGRPTRELWFVPLDATSRWKAKNFIDTAIYRASDAAGAWALAALRPAFGALPFFAWISVPVALLWTFANLRLGRPRPSATAVAPAAAGLPSAGRAR